MKRFVAGMLTMLMVSPLLGQSVEIFGYVEPQLMGARVKGQTYQLSSNKLRLDIQARPSDRVVIGANMNWLTYHGTTEWDILDFLPESVLAEVSLAYNPYVLPYSDRQYLDNAYVKLDLGNADLTIGKQQISLGTGYVWNPTDVFNQKDVLDPTYEQPGHNAIRLDVPLTNQTTFTSLYAPSKWNEFGDALIKLKTTLGHFDISLSGIRQAWALSDARLIDLFSMQFQQLPTTRRTVGGDLAGELLGVGLWVEAASHYVDIKDKDMGAYLSSVELMNRQPLWSSAAPSAMSLQSKYYELDIGMDYTFDSQTYLMAEYYRNTWANADSKNYRFTDWMQLLAGEVKTIARDQIYTLVQHPLTDLVQLGCSMLYAKSDNSGAIIPILTWNALENVELTIIGNYYWGKTGTAYASSLGNGGLARIRVYF